MFRWKRGVLDGLMAFGVIVFFGLTVLIVDDPADPEKLGEGTGQLAMVAFLVGLGVSYLRQTGRRKAARAVIGVVGVLVVAVVIAIDQAPSRSRELTAADRAPLVERQVGGVARLVHQTLGFSILRPPPSFQASPAMASILQNGDASMATYVYADEPPQAIVGISVIPGTDLAASVRGVRMGFEKSLARELGRRPTIEWLENDVRGDEANLHGAFEAAHMRLASHVLRDKRMIVHVMVMGPDPTALADVLGSFQREP